MRPNTRPRMSAINYTKTLSTISRHYWQELYEWHNSTDRSPVRKIRRNTSLRLLITD
uniref:Uncharacterized protein n=1 Tax=Anopheles atroparvus TaxID=41427 RepID=A0AAG5DPS0_ANOAO